MKNGSWEYETTSVKIGERIIDGKSVDVFALCQRKTRFIPNWHINPITKVWEQCEQSNTELS